MTGRKIKLTHYPKAALIDIRHRSALLWKSTDNTGKRSDLLMMRHGSQTP